MIAVCHARRYDGCAGTELTERGREVAIEDAVLASLRELPLDKQQEVLDFVEFLRHQSPSRRGRRPLKGLWTGVQITDEDIADVRRDMWGRFPREDV
jgi:hypothetical protein